MEAMGAENFKEEIVSIVKCYRKFSSSWGICTSSQIVQMLTVVQAS